jgi:predicted Fe-Mo cluster-binding NifX family protein/NAD-dependent dihydropyrimidine dehydrogenase PreA subunit
MKIAVTSTGPTLDDTVEARFGRCAYFLIIDAETMQYEPMENPNIALGGGAGIQSAQLMSEKGVTAVLTGNCGPNAFNVFGQAGIQVIVGLSGPVRNAVEQFKASGFTSASGPSVSSHFGINTVTPGTTSSDQPITGPMNQSQGLGMPLSMGGGRGMGKGMGRGGGMGHGGGIGRGGEMGRGGGMSRGMGRGMGKGGGMGRGRGMGIETPIGMPSTSSPERYPQGTGTPMNPEQELAALKQQAELLEKQKQQLNQRINQLESGPKAVAVVDSEKCTGCGICISVCPTGAIEINQQAVINEEACNGCAACVSECPNEAIVITQRKID